jgi:hypothetical protein
MLQACQPQKEDYDDARKVRYTSESYWQRGRRLDIAGFLDIAHDRLCYGLGLDIHAI